MFRVLGFGLCEKTCLFSLLLLGTFSALLTYYVYLVTYIRTIRGFETVRKEIATLKGVRAVAHG